MCLPNHGFLFVFDPFPAVLSFEHMKSGDANLQIGELKNAIQENGAPGPTARISKLSRSVSSGERKSLAILKALMT